MLILLSLGTGFIFNTIYIWPKQYPSSMNQPHTLLTQISMEHAYELVQRKQAVIVDTRDPEAYAHSHIAGAINLPLSQFDNYYPDFASQVEKSQTIILYCSAGCGIKEKVATRLQQHGYQDINAIAAGPKEWAAAGYPVAKEENPHITEGERQ